MQKSHLPVCHKDYMYVHTYVVVVHSSYTIYHESFKAEKFCGKLYTQTFVKNISRNLSLKSIFEQRHLKFWYKKFCGHAKSHENCATFLPRNFHGIWLAYKWLAWYLYPKLEGYKPEDWGCTYHWYQANHEAYMLQLICNISILVKWTQLPEIYEYRKPY